MLERDDDKLLAIAHPEAARGIRERARAEKVILAMGFPGDTVTGLLDDDESAEETWCDLHRDRPCPALDPDSSRCLLYEARPLSCRTFGLPVRAGGEDLPPCGLCFRGASASEIEDCRVEVDPGGVEEKILGDHALDERDTTISWALTGEV